MGKDLTEIPNKFFISFFFFSPKVTSLSKPIHFVKNLPVWINCSQNSILPPVHLWSLVGGTSGFSRSSRQLCYTDTFASVTSQLPGLWGSRVLWTDPELWLLQPPALPASVPHHFWALIPMDRSGQAGTLDWEASVLYFNESSVLVPTSTVFLHSFQNGMFWVSLVFSCLCRNRKKTVNCAKKEFRAVLPPLQWKCWLLISFSHSPICQSVNMFLIRNVNFLFP